MTTAVHSILRYRGHLLVLALLCGVLAMHALTVGHNPEHSVEGAVGGAVRGTTDGAMATHRADPGSLTVALQQAADTPASAPCHAGCDDHLPSRGGHSTTAICLAVVGALGVVAGSLLLLGARRPVTAGEAFATTTSPGWWTSTLSTAPRRYSLCVLRT